MNDATRVLLTIPHPRLFLRLAGTARVGDPPSPEEQSSRFELLYSAQLERVRTGIQIKK